MREDGAHLRGVVAAELRDLARQAARVERIEDRFRRRRIEIALEDDQVVALLARRNESQPIDLGGDANRDAEVGLPASNRGRDFEVSSELARIALDAVGADAEFADCLIERGARTRTELAIGDAQARAREISKASQLERIPRRRRDAELPEREVH